MNGFADLESRNRLSTQHRPFFFFYGDENEANSARFLHPSTATAATLGAIHQ